MHQGFHTAQQHVAGFGDPSPRKLVSLWSSLHAGAGAVAALLLLLLLLLYLPKLRNEPAKVVKTTGVGEGKRGRNGAEQKGR